MQILTEEIVHEICKLLQEDELSATEISDELDLYSISVNPIGLVSAIRNKKIWTSISDQYQFPMGAHGRKFTDKQIMQICEAIEHNPYVTTEYILSSLCIEPKNYTELIGYRNTISAIKNRRKYIYISENYNF